MLQSMFTTLYVVALVRQSFKWSTPAVLFMMWALISRSCRHLANRQGVLTLHVRSPFPRCLMTRADCSCLAMGFIQPTAFQLSSTCTACRTGNVLVNGTIGNAIVSSSGTGSVYLLGTNTSVVVDLAGVSSVYLRNANRKSTCLLLVWCPGYMLPTQPQYCCVKVTVQFSKIGHWLSFEV